ncbi:MAG: PQQ-binding-like beta-propeller repeat protein, partial [Planctomycetota bacterium]
FVSAADHMREVLLSVPEWIASLYQTEYDRLAATALGHAFEGRDPAAVAEAARRFPLAGSAGTALVHASDLHLASGRTLEAAALLDGASPKVLARESRVTEEQREEISALAFRRFDVGQVAERQLRIARVLGQTDRFAHWQKVLAERGATTILEPPTVVRATEKTLPELKRDRARLEWETTPFDRRAFQHHRYALSIDVPYACPPTVRDENGELLPYFVVNTPTRLLRFGWDGRAQQSRELEQAMVTPSGNVRHHQAQRFREFDPLLRLAPVVAAIPKTDETFLIGTYVASATADEQYSGYQITASVPKRALIAVEARRGGRVQWDTASPETELRDPLLASLSFNAPPVTVGGKIYALGWQKVGTINAVAVCLDAKTGEALWKTIVVGNQIDLTMFGEISHEPFLGGVAVRDGQVYLNTQLGVLAALGASDGEVRWICPYESARPQPHRRHYDNFRRKEIWERNPLVLYEDRMIVTPLDSEQALSVELETGRILQEVHYRRLGRFMLGLHGPHLVFCDRDSIVRVVARDLLQRIGDDVRLPCYLDARPALVQGGIVYTTDEGLYRQAFDPLTDPVELATFATRSHQEYDFIQAGDVVVVSGVEDATLGSGLPTETKILVANSDKIRCFEEVLPPAERNR